MGDSLKTTKHIIKYSIEKEYKLYLYCKNKFIEDKNIKIIHGDSKEVLNDLLHIINEPVYIFLDASTQATSMLIDEIELIKKIRTKYSDFITFHESNIGKIDNNGNIITIEYIHNILQPTYKMVKNGEFLLIQKPGSDTSEHTSSSSSDSF